jgi:hypothetical protein
MQRSTDRAVYRLNQAKPSLGTIPSMQGLTSMEDGDLIAACERFRADHAEWDKQVRSRQSPVGGECDLVPRFVNTVTHFPADIRVTKRRVTGV